MNYEQAIKDLQDNLVVIAEIERRQSAILREHTERIQQHERYQAEVNEYRRRIDQNLAEITDKLNGLIGCIDRLPRNPPN